MAAPPDTSAPRDQPSGLSLRYERAGKEGQTICRIERELQPDEGCVYVYATIHTGPANPLKHVGGLPEWRPEGGVVATDTPQDVSAPRPSAPAGFETQERQPLPDGQPQFLETIALGRRVADKFLPAIRFGLSNDRQHAGLASVCGWVSDGKVDYFGPFLRPATPDEFKLRVDFKNQRLSAWVNGPGDDDWFLLVEDAVLLLDVPKIDGAQVEMSSNAPPIEGLQGRMEPHPELETVRPQPRVKRDRVVDVDREFRFQSPRSAWRQPGKQVTVFRQPGVHAALVDVALASPRHWIAVWRPPHTGGSRGISVASSHDLGRTWEGPILLTPHGTVTCPRIQRLWNGSLIVLSDSGGGVDSVDVWRSADEGKTWNKLPTFEPRRAGGGNACYASDRFLELRDGSWLLSTSCEAWIPGVRQSIRGDTERLDFYRSTDGGQTWSFVSGPLASPPHILSEPSTLEIAPGRLVSYARDSNGARPGARLESNDAGKTEKWRDLPFPIVERNCVGVLSDGRVMNTFRAAVGRASLWAWVGDTDDATGPQPVGAHFNDRRSVGLREGGLHIDNDGVRGQFTKYFWPSLESPQSRLDLRFEVKVLANSGRAASVVVSFAGVLRLFPDHVAMAHDPALRADIKPGEFHTYRIQSRKEQMQLWIDGQFIWETDKGLDRLEKVSSWLPVVIPRHGLAFGNEVVDSTNWFYVKPTDLGSEVSGHSTWRSFEATTENPHENTGRRVVSWKASNDRFPDQYQLNHIVEVEASANWLLLLRQPQLVSSTTLLKSKRVPTVTSRAIPAGFNSKTAVSSWSTTPTTRRPWPKVMAVATAYRGSAARFSRATTCLFFMQRFCHETRTCTQPTGTSRFQSPRFPAEGRHGGCWPVHAEIRHRQGRCPPARRRR